MLKPISKIFGGQGMNLKQLISAAVLSGCATGILMLLPLQGSSFQNIGICFEAWLLLALCVINRCAKPFEAGWKTFLFFLISQPLVYLVQVPFSSMGFGLFSYYPRWFFMTLLTFPGGILAWHVRDRRPYSVVILLCAEALLAYEFSGHFSSLLRHFPLQLFACLLILAEMILFPLNYSPERKKRGLVLTVSALFLALSLLLFTDILIRKAAESTYFLGEGDYLVESCDEGLELDVFTGYVRVRVMEKGSYAFSLRSGEGMLLHFTVEYDDFPEIILEDPL